MRKVIALLGVLVACNTCSKNNIPSVQTNTLAPTVSVPTPTPTPLAPLTCDEALWKPTYSLDRLKVLSSCETEVGVVKFVELEYDGDMVIDIKPATDRLLLPGNVNVDAPGCGASGCLHVEVPCQGPINSTVQPDADGACDGFTGTKIVPPEIGEVIEAAAHWVADLRHEGWAELHGAVVRVLY